MNDDKSILMNENVKALIDTKVKSEVTRQLELFKAKYVASM